MEFGHGLKDFYINVPAAPGQAVKTRLLLFVGDWFLDASEGTPYISGILGKHSQAQADSIVRSRTLNTQGISGISSFQSALNPETRHYSAEETVNTIYGRTTVEIGDSNIPVFPVLNNELITQSGFVITTQSGKVLTT